MRRQSRPEETIEAGSEPDPASSPSDPVPADVDATPATFPVVRKGFDPAAVEQHLAGVADELRRARAEAEAARLEARRLRRELDDAHAELASPEPDTNEAIAVLGDEANRVIHAARQSSQEIIATAEAAAEDIRARAREEARQIAEEARRDAEDFDGRLSGQADEVRQRLREEIRRARTELAAETDAARARTRAEADEILAAAREEASTIRAEAEETSRSRRDQAGALAEERLAEADETVAARIAEAETSAAAIVAGAEEARATILAELQGQRERLEEHVRVLQGAQARARADIGAAQTMLAALLEELGQVRLRDLEIPPLALELEMPVASEAEAEADVQPVDTGAEEPVDAEDADADVVAAEIVDETEAAPAEVDSLDFDEAEPPDDAEIEALFDRVVAHRAGAEPAPLGEAGPAEVRDGGEAGEWGYADDAEARPERASQTVVAGAAELSTQERLLAALHRFALDTGEIPLVSVVADGNGDDDAAVADGTDADTSVPATSEPVPAATELTPVEELEANGVVAELVPALTRKVKRALQEVENAALDVDRASGAVVDATTILTEYLLPAVVDTVALGFGGEVGERDLRPDAEFVVRTVCGSWADELGSELSETDRAGAPALVRKARRAAKGLAEDLTRTAYETGRRRAQHAAR